MDDHSETARLAAAAGQLLLDLRAAHGAGSDPAELRAAGDQRSNALLLRELAAAHPDDAVLSEESEDDTGRLTSSRIWIVDPLDGTREYAEPGRTDWAVHVALWRDGALAAGAVALPARGLVLSTAAPPELAARSDRPVRLAVSRTRPPAITEHLRARLDAELVPMGSAGAKAMAVLLGEADVYAHAGGQYEWDSCAPVAVAAAAGLHCSRIDGAPLVYNRPDPWMPDLLVCHPNLVEQVLAVTGP